MDRILKIPRGKSLLDLYELLFPHRHDLTSTRRTTCEGGRLKNKVGGLARLASALSFAVALTFPATLAASAKDDAIQTVRVAGIVLKWVRGDKEANFCRAVPLIRKAARDGAKIICTTECFLDGYAIADKTIPLEQYRQLGEPIPGGRYFRKLAALAAELKVHLVVGLLEADGENRYNTAVLIGPDGTLVGKYRKQKLGHESTRNTAGKDSPVFPTPYGRLGLMICADRTEPALVRHFCDRGAEFLICPSGGMFGPRDNDPILQARSRENRVPIVFVHPAEFLITGPDGSVLDRTTLGDTLLVAADEVGQGKDRNRVFTFDLRVRPRPACRIEGEPGRLKAPRVDDSNCREETEW
jgi:predicted amidohydrolase